MAYTVALLNMRKLSTLPEGAIYIGRYNPKIGYASKWANWIKLERESDRDLVLINYENDLKKRGELLADRHELVGKDLACWCFPKPCHGAILGVVRDFDDLELAIWQNSPKSCLDEDFFEWLDEVKRRLV